jgi:DNA helicase IV
MDGRFVVVPTMTTRTGSDPELRAKARPLIAQGENVTHGDDELHVEQHTVDRLYRRLDQLRAQATERLSRVKRVGPSGSPQNRSERDAFASMYEDRLAQLEAVEDRLCFGRLDLTDSEVRYIGRIGLTDTEHVPILTDWRAPAAQAFYRATAAQPDCVVRRRHLLTRGRAVMGLEDEVLDLEGLDRNDAVDVAHLSGEGALFAALNEHRTGHMGDIVATIQAEQDAIIRSELAGVLVVQGGPGTGKTAVALHRAAYLLYAHRRLLERSGALLIGPSRTFLTYIERVLPSLGETGVVTSTMAELVPGIEARGTETDEVAEIKGRAAMATVVQRAVRDRQRLPAGDQEFKVDGRILVISRTDVAAAQARARRNSRPHNQARVTFVREMLARLAEQYVEQLSYPLAADERGEVIEEMRTTREVRIALNLAWMPLTPEHLVEDLFARPEDLARTAPELSPRERRLLVRARGSEWTPADIPLLDEAAEELGEDDQARRAHERAEAERREADLEFAQRVASTSGSGMVTAEMIAERFADSGPRLTTAERAARDRTWAYGHIVVDEAQELSAMAWRMLVRRCPTRSMTVVGDLAQTSSPAGARNWATVLDPILHGRWRRADLTVNYRTPAAVAELAQQVVRAAGLVPGQLTSARSVPDAVRVTFAPDPEHLAATAVAETRALWAEHTAAGTEPGQVAVLVHPDRLDGVHAALAASPLAALLAPHGASGSVRAPLSVLTARTCKGLEFDVVVLLEPTELLQGGPGDLYVAMTRPTRQLRIVHARELPPGMEVAASSEPIRQPRSQDT